MSDLSKLSYTKALIDVENRYTGLLVEAIYKLQSLEAGVERAKDNIQDIHKNFDNEKAQLSKSFGGTTNE